ncbi:hypothetical protein C8046_17205 [Serinibacter arcticus]|uniref:Uncharacterized protein n=1 Tax=Serinibacter arcticus TaxID=1655435 RepID=A0A2U1ZYV4_9MICO|nr:hypothetical protein C8046_17205 [Serinibacter arcticus]
MASTFLAAPSSAVDTGFYSVPYADTLYYHEHYSGSDEVTFPAQYEMWQSSGFPTPRPAPVRYVKYPWSSDIWAVHFFGPDREDWVWSVLDYGQWSRAGRPAPSDAGWIEGSTYWQYASSPEIFVAIWEDEPAHKLTPAEWRAAGSPAPERLWNQGIYTYPWSSSIGYVWDTPTGDGDTLTFEDWAFLGFPTPQTVNHLSYEHVWRFRGSSQLYLDSAITGIDFPLTFGQWSALGRPAPVIY